MDARDLKFLDDTFSTVTAFFSFMFMGSRENQLKVLQEIHRVMRSGGLLHFWEIDLEQRPQTDAQWYLIRFRIKLPDREVTTGYGQKWPSESRGQEYYRQLAVEAGFLPVSAEKNRITFKMVFKKI